MSLASSSDWFIKGAQQTELLLFLVTIIVLFLNFTSPVVRFPVVVRPSANSLGRIRNISNARRRPQTKAYSHNCSPTWVWVEEVTQSHQRLSLVSFRPRSWRLHYYYCGHSIQRFYLFFFCLFVCLLLVIGLLEFSRKGEFSIISFFFFSKKIYLRTLAHKIFQHWVSFWDFSHSNMMS